MAKMISVIGSPNSGSSTFAGCLAKAYCAQKYNVALIYADDVVPSIPVFLPRETTPIEDEKNEKKSIGKLFAIENVTDKDILSQMVCIPGNSKLVLLGYAFGENRFTYPQATDYAVYSLYSKIAELVDIIIVDCAHNLENSLSRIALENTDYIIRCASCDYKSISYYTSNLSMVPEKTVSSDDHFVIFPKRKNDENPRDFESYHGKIDFILDENKAVSEMIETGELFLNPMPKKYKTIIGNLIKEMSING